MDSEQQNLDNEENCIDLVIIERIQIRYPRLSAMSKSKEEENVLKDEIHYSGPYRNPKSLISSDSDFSTVLLGSKRKASESFSIPSPKKTRLVNNLKVILKPVDESKKPDTSVTKTIDNILGKLPLLTLGEKMNWFMPHLNS